MFKSTDSAIKWLSSLSKSDKYFNNCVITVEYDDGWSIPVCRGMGFRPDEDEYYSSNDRTLKGAIEELYAQYRAWTRAEVKRLAKGVLC
jgi:hypothetical protein